MSNALPVGVLVVGRFHVDAVSTHIAETFEAMGHPVVRFETTARVRATGSKLQKRIDQVRTRLGDLGSSLPFVRERFTRRLLQAARSRPIGITMVCHDFLQPHEVAAVRDATGGPTALWFPDHLGNFGRAWFINAPYDALFFKDPYILHILGRAYEKPLYYLPECFNPVRLKAPPLSHEDRRVFGCDVATAGNLYTHRAEFFRQLADFDVKIWGNPPPLWMDAKPIEKMIQYRYVVNEDKARAFQCARVVVNNLNPAEVWGINARAFEIAGAGGFQLIDWRPGLGQLFAEGEELVPFLDMPDLREKLVHYLAHPDERDSIARRGRDRAHRDHTFEARLSLLRDTVLGSATGYPVPEFDVRRRS